MERGSDCALICGLLVSAMRSGPDGRAPLRAMFLSRFSRRRPDRGSIMHPSKQSVSRVESKAPSDVQRRSPAWLLNNSPSVLAMRASNNSCHSSQHCGAWVRFAPHIPSVQRSRGTGARGKTPSREYGQTSWCGCSKNPTSPRKLCSNDYGLTTPVGSMIVNFEHCNAGSRNGVESWPENLSMPVWTETKLQM